MTPATEIGAIMQRLAAERPDHQAARSDAVQGQALFVTENGPNSLIGHALVESGVDTDECLKSWLGLTGYPADVFEILGVETSDAMAAWLKRVARAEDHGQNWGDAIAGAGPRPIEVPVEDGVYGGIPDTVYHADRDSLSSSGAKTLVTPGGPAKYRHADRVEKAEYDYGHVAHALILGEGSDIVIVQADDWRSKAAREKRDQAYADGQVPILAKTYAQAVELREAVMRHDLARIIFEDGLAEQSIYAHDPETGVRLRCRPDWWYDTTFVDIKTTTSADPGSFRKSIGEYGYHQSAAFYLDVAKLAGVEADRFFFLAVEKKKPFLCSVLELDPADIEDGRRLNRAAIDLYARCRETDTWPGLRNELFTVSLPPWSRAAADDNIINARLTLEGMNG